MTTIFQFGVPDSVADFCGFFVLLDFNAIIDNPNSGGGGNNQEFKVQRQVVLQVSELGQVIWSRETDFLVDGDIKLRLKAPDGAFVPLVLSDTNDEPAVFLALSPSLPEQITIIANPESKLSLNSADDLTPSLPRFINGRLLDLKGERELEDIQVIIWGSQESGSQTEDFEVLFTVQTEEKGYFSIPYPKTTFTEAYATVGLPDIGSVPIRLRFEGTGDNGFFPKNLILVVDAPAKEDCDEDCQCQSLNVLGKKQVLEEFSFYSVVRTTEPEIKSVELIEEEEISLSTITNIVPDFGVLVQRSVSLLPYTMTRLNQRDSTNPGFVAAPMQAPSQAVLEAWMGETTINTKLLRKYVNSEKGLTEENVAELIHKSNSDKLARHLLLKNQVVPGRSVINASNPIDWDDDPTIYQATTIAHGHLLQFKQEWTPDGYSLGDLLYSLPLAPGQKKNIVVFDWERREAISNIQSRDFQERLYNTLGRDRTINEIVRGSLQENTRGGSESSTNSFSAGLGLAGIVSGIAGVFGASGGRGASSSEAWQESSRNTSASSLQRLSDRITQSANAMRSQRSTVIQTASQGERFEVQSETIANYNHCHSMTIQYFEVLRHFRIQTRLADVRECLFVPLEITPFNQEKALRWRGILSDTLLDRELLKGFDAMEETIDNFEDSDIINATYADEDIVDLNGEIWLRFQIARPKDENDEFNPSAWSPLVHLFGFNPQDFYNDYLKDQRFKDRVFHRELGPKIAEALVQRLTFSVNGNSALPVEATLVSRYGNNINMRVSLRRASRAIESTRDNIDDIRISFDDNDFGDSLLPEGSKVVLTAGSLRYRTEQISGYIFNDRNINNDLAINGAPEQVIITSLPLTEKERTNPRADLVKQSNQLITHLNDNLEYYHHTIWRNMTPARRFMLLDGIIAPCKANGRSVASVVENNLIGIVGNCLVMPVAPGFQLDPTYEPEYTNTGERISLTELYQTATPEPIHLSIPTKGVYAEAIMGKCNSCEEIEDQRFWRWEESPIPDSPTAINPIDTSSRRSEVPVLQPGEFPASIINLQNAPAAPDPAGVAGLLQLLGKADSFRDITGLTENQKNALAALKASFDTTTSFGKEAASIFKQAQSAKELDKNLKKVNESKNLTAADKRELEKAMLKKAAGIEEKKPADTTKKESASEKLKNIGDQIKKTGGKGTVSQTETPEGATTTETTLEVYQPKFASSGSDSSDEVPPLVTVDRNDPLFWCKVRWLIIINAEREETNWTAPDGTKLRENKRDSAGNFAMQPYLENYWSAVRWGGNEPSPPAHRNISVATSTSNSIADTEAWSAAFISYVLFSSHVQVTDGFEFSRRHISYIVQALANREQSDMNKPFWLYGSDEIGEAPFEMGDIICFNRQTQNGWGTYSYSSLRNAYWDDDSNGLNTAVENIGGSAHCNIIVSVYEENGDKYIETIGGNEGDSVRRRKWKLDENGSFIDTSYYRYFGHIKLMKCPDFTIPNPLVGLEDPEVGGNVDLDDIIEESDNAG